MSFADVQSILGAIGYWLGVLLLVLLALLLLGYLILSIWDWVLRRGERK